MHVKAAEDLLPGQASPSEGLASTGDVILRSKSPEAASRCRWPQSAEQIQRGTPSPRLWGQGRVRDGGLMLSQHSFSEILHEIKRLGLPEQKENKVSVQSSPLQRSALVAFTASLYGQSPTSQVG